MTGLKLTLGNSVLYFAAENLQDYYLEKAIAEAIHQFLMDHGGTIVNGKPSLRSDPIEVEVKD